MNNYIFWDVVQCDLVRTEVQQECAASIFRVERISELGTALAIC
jgi:hypothetical protein